MVCLLSTTEAEALGLRNTIIWLGDMGVLMVLIELYCKLVVVDIVGNSINHTRYGNILKACIQFLDLYPNFKISFIRKQAKYIAHSLARMPSLYARPHTFESISSCVFSIVVNEII
jgi:hypothetical protein